MTWLGSESFTRGCARALARITSGKEQGGPVRRRRGATADSAAARARWHGRIDGLVRFPPSPSRWFQCSQQRQPPRTSCRKGNEGRGRDTPIHRRLQESAHVRTSFPPQRSSDLCSREFAHRRANHQARHVLARPPPEERRGRLGGGVRLRLGLSLSLGIGIFVKQSPIQGEQ